MPGAGWSKPKPLHWRALFRPWLDILRSVQGRWTTAQWEAWALEQAKPWGMQKDVREFFWSHVRAGIHPSIAASWALDEWDC